jgi:hypothetical protein
MALDDKTQRWLMYAIIAFNVTVILLMIIFSMTRSGGMAGLYFRDFFITLVLACVVGGGVFWASMKLQL